MLLWVPLSSAVVVGVCIWVVWGLEADGGGDPAGEAEVDVEHAEDSGGDQHVFGVCEV